MKQNLHYKILPYTRYNAFYREKESFYRSFINQYYLDFASKAKEEEAQCPPHLTNTIIAPHDIPFGASPRKVIWKIGMPSFQIKDTNDFKDHKILFYKTKLLRQRVLIQFHFINGYFYYSQLSFLSFTEKTNNILSESIKNKYQCTGSFADNGERIHMSDICGNTVIIEKGVYLTVSYITGENYPKTLMEGQIENRKEQLSKADQYEVSRLSKVL
jgi:hypothetical protein